MEEKERRTKEGRRVKTERRSVRDSNYNGSERRADKDRRTGENRRA
jgi:hypothetical protein